MTSGEPNSTAEKQSIRGSRGDLRACEPKWLLGAGVPQVRLGQEDWTALGEATSDLVTNCQVWWPLLGSH